MLGHKLCQYLPTRGHDVTGAIRKAPGSLHRFSSVYSHTTLIGGIDALSDETLARTIRDTKPEFVINCIGIVKQLQEAENAYLSVAVNSYLPHRLARLCEAHGAHLIHISTDCVFDGTRGSYTEKDFSDARDMYGKSKFLGETTAGDKCAVTLRTSFVGRELHQPAHGLVEWFLAQEKKVVKGFARAIYSGFTSLELARVIAQVIERTPRLSGLYQAVSAPINKYDLLLVIREAYGLNITVERDENFQCDRSMQGTIFHEATGYTAPSWNQMIQEMRSDPTPYDQFVKETITNSPAPLSA
jgi:dTDP-4-dehydrorhamnose reductase